MNKRISLAISLVALSVALGFVAPVHAQELACRAAGGGAVAPTAVGSVEAWPTLAPPLLIGSDTRATPLSDGSAVILDRSKNDLMRVDRATGHTTALARSGEGPGELTGPLTVVGGGSDTVVVVDVGNHRITRFDRAGHVATSYPYQFAGISTLVAKLGQDVIEVNRTIGSRGTSMTPVLTIRALRPDSAVTLRTVPLPDPTSAVGLFTPSGTGAVLDATHLLLASGATPDVRVVGVVGGADHTTHLDLGAPLPMSHDMAQRLLTLASTQIPAASRAAAVSGMLQAVPLAPYYPMLTRLVVGTAGHLWVQRTFTGEGPTGGEPPATFSMNDLGGYVWQQFSPAGARTAECTMPKDWRVVGAGAGWVLFAEDEAENTRLFTWRLK